MGSRVVVTLQKYSFYPGERVLGEALCYFRSPKEIRKIRIRLRGQEKTDWTNQESYYDSNSKETRYRDVSYTGRNDIVLIDHQVHGPGTLPSGEYKFPIQFQLPNVLPSSYHCYYGKIYYTIKVTVDRPFKFDIEETVGFKISAPIRLEDLSRNMLTPTELHDEKTICCWCCAGGNVEIKLPLENRAFTVGQTKNLEIYVLNMSNINTDGLEVELKQKITYTTTSPSRDYRSDSELLARARSTGIGAHGEKTYNLPLTIPENSVVPNFNSSQLFETQYKLKVTVVLPGCRSNLEVSTLVAVGHIPLATAPTMHIVITPPELGLQRTASWVNINEEATGLLPEGHRQPMPMPMPMPMPVHMPVAMPMPMPTYMPVPSQACASNKPTAPFDECSAPPSYDTAMDEPSVKQ